MTSSTLLITDAPFDPEEALKNFREGVTGAGAIVSFTGIVREQARGGLVKGLTLQHYQGYTERQITQMAATASDRWSLEGWHIVHRVGDIAPLDPIVFVATASAHRRSAFEAVDHMMDMLKTDAPFWKKEHREDGEEWIEPRAEDYQDRARWAKRD